MSKNLAAEDIRGDTKRRRTAGPEHALFQGSTGEVPDIPPVSLDKRTHRLPSHDQGTMIKTIRAELLGTTFESVALIHELFPSSDAQVSAVLSALQKNPNHTSTTYPWPQTRSEIAFYKPLSNLLNAVNDAARNVSSKTYYDELRYSPYNRTTTDSIRGSDALKPDVVGCNREVDGNVKEKVSWAHDILIPVEVKSNWSQMVEQAATYARCLFVADSHREFAIAIAFNHHTQCLRFLCFHRGGLTSTPEMKLREQEGWRSFVQVMTGIMSWEGAYQAGMDIASSNSFYMLPSPFGLYEISQKLFTRPSVRGRATQVSRLRLPSKDSFTTHSTTFRSGSAVMTTPMVEDRGSSMDETPIIETEDSTADWDDQVLDIEDVPSKRVLVSYNPTMTGLDTSPESLIIKDSYPLKRKNNEIEMFNDVQGQFGIPEMYGSYVVKRPNGEEQSTTRFSPPDSVYWNLFNTTETCFQPENRVHSIQLFKTQGKRLDEASSPRELVEAILHSMTGYLNLFIKGWLHRDVSEGNIMLLEEPITQEKVIIDVMKYPGLAEPARWTRCIGVLTDGDLAIRWKDAVRGRPVRQSGTLPFVALRVLKHVNVGRGYTHTPIDDLESFLWVLLWVILHITRRIQGLTVEEHEVLCDLQSLDIKISQLGRSDSIDTLQLQQDSGSPIVKMLLPLMADWKDISSRASKDAETVTARLASDGADSSTKSAQGSSDEGFNAAAVNKITDMTYKYISEYLEAGCKHLATLPDTWPAVTDSDS